MPAKVHADEVLHKLGVGRDSRPGTVRVLDLLVLLFRIGVWRVGRLVVLAKVYQVRGPANIPRRPVLQPQLAHLPAQLALKGRLDRRDSGRREGADRLVLLLLAILLCYDGLGDGVQALARPYLLHEPGDIFLGVVEDGLDEGLQGRVARLEVVNVLLVDALAAVVRVRVVDALGVVDGGAGGAGGRGAVALSYMSTLPFVRVGVVAAERRGADGATRSHTLLFLFLQGTHALEMQRRFLLASSSSAFFFPRRPFFAGGWFACVCVVFVSAAALACAAVPAVSMPVSRDGRCTHCGVSDGGGAMTGDRALSARHQSATGENRRSYCRSWFGAEVAVNMAGPECLAQREALTLAGT